MAKAKKQKLSWKGSVLSIAYPSIGKVCTFDVSKYGKPMQEAARLHGFAQKFGDAESGGTAAEKFAAVQEIHESLSAGDWNRERGVVDTLPQIAAAVARIKGATVEVATKVLEAMTPEKLADVKGRADVKAAVAQIRAEKLAAIAEDDDGELEIPGLE